MDKNMDLNKQDMNMNENQLNNFMEAVENMDVNKQVFEKDNELESDRCFTRICKSKCSYRSLVIQIESLVILDESHEIHDKSHEPHVEGIPIPVEGTWYDTVDEAIDMYSKYAEIGGFEVKKSGQRLTKSGVVKHKYIMCNREGVPKSINVGTLDPEYSEKQKRNTTTHVTGCKARIKLVLDIVSGRYKLDQFYPKHNHMLIPKEYKHFTKKQRKMTQAEKMFVVKAATNKIGATRAHNLLSSMKGGYEYVHGTTDDFKNHQRDVNVFIGESDAQMLINKMENRKTYVPNFTFQYRVENSELVSMFWADEVAKCNYKEFGDIVSFDATFNSNKYNMKFVPFIGIDNHGKCVTLGSGMLLHEDTKSYTWLLTAFMTAFLKEPTMIVTDQDGAMKRAIEAVFTKSKHRLCMWHIMQKIPSKICKQIYNETDFKERFDKIVWNMFIEPLKFEEKWAKLIEDFGLQNHKWMTKMFNIREIWIPAYFVDSPLFGLMRTTSRSESENSFFKSFTSPGATLVSFMMSYESAMERQRYRQEALDFKTIEAAPKCETKLPIELHAARVYTRTIFLLVQTEIIQGCWTCTIQDLKINEGCETVIIRDKNPKNNTALNTKKGKEQEKKSVAETARDFKVLRIIEDGSVVCSCRHFLRYGFLCRHIFCVFKNRDINVIPKQYILRRWTRDIIPPDLRRQRNRYGEKNLTIERLTNEANFLVDDSLFLLSKDERRMGTYVEKLKILLDEVKADMPNPASRNTGDVIGGIFSISKPNQVDVKNPTKAVNKGEHLKNGERLKSEREKAIKVKVKAMKVCGYCQEKTNEHTKITCPKNPKARKKKKLTQIIDI
ncbi:FAR1-related sequence 5-like protein [Tanacetum coccineum]|uniref:FAR1-related sequence 5-like protein n=1 Tax=Tanacetum coccineum TaxID=301880 RepID=A0ABQ4YBW0_9ASTR